MPRKRTQSQGIGNCREGPRLCEKSEVQFGFRTSVSISSDLKTNSASNCRRERTTKKTILRFFCRCDFSHSLGQKPTHAPQQRSGGCTLICSPHPRAPTA